MKNKEIKTNNPRNDVQLGKLQENVGFKTLDYDGEMLTMELVAYAEYSRKNYIAKVVENDTDKVILEEEVKFSQGYSDNWYETIRTHFRAEKNILYSAVLFDLDGKILSKQPIYTGILDIKRAHFNMNIDEIEKILAEQKLFCYARIGLIQTKIVLPENSYPIKNASYQIYHDYERSPLLTSKIEIAKAYYSVVENEGIYSVLLSLDAFQYNKALDLENYTLQGYKIRQATVKENDGFVATYQCLSYGPVSEYISITDEEININPPHLIFPSLNISKVENDSGIIKISWGNEELKKNKVPNIGCQININNSDDKDSISIDVPYQDEFLEYNASGIPNLFSVKMRLQYPGSFCEKLGNHQPSYGEWSESFSLINEIPEITNVETTKDKSTFSISVEWNNSQNPLDNILIEIISINKEVIAKKICSSKDGSVSFDQTVLDNTESYYVISSYFDNDEYYGPSSNAVDIIQITPQYFTINYIENSDEIGDTLYNMIANWENNFSLNGEYIEIEYINSESQSQIINLPPDTTPPLQITDHSIVQARIRQRTEKSIGPWSKEVNAPYIGTTKYDFDSAGRLLETKIVISTVKILNNKFEYDNRGNIISTELINH